MTTESAALTLALVRAEALQTLVKELEGQVTHWRKAWADTQVQWDLFGTADAAPAAVLVVDMRRELRSALRRLHRIGEYDATKDAERLTEILLRADALFGGLPDDGKAQP